MLLVKVMKGKSSVTCIKISNGTMQLEVCHSAFAFHSFCHRGAELETIKQRITSPKGLLAVLMSFPLLFLRAHCCAGALLRFQNLLFCLLLRCV